MTTALQELLDRAVQAGTIPGVVALLGSGDDKELATAGVAALGGERMRGDAIMRIQSMTKAVTGGAHAGRYGWSGGQGTNFFVDPDGTVGILFTQVELGAQMGPLVDAFQALHPAAG